MQMVCKVTVVGFALLTAGVALGAAPPAGALPLNGGVAAVSPAPAATLADSSPVEFDLDGPRAQLDARNAPAEVPVEAIPTPTAVKSGILALAILAGYRALRRLRLA